MESTEQLEHQIEVLQQKVTLSRQELFRKRSRTFIATNRITRDDVHLSDEADTEYFGHVEAFMAYLRRLPHSRLKRFAEWNGLIHFTSDLIAGVFVQDWWADLKDVPEAKGQSDG